MLGLALLVPEHLPYHLEIVAMHRAVIPLAFVVLILGLTFPRARVVPAVLCLVLASMSSKYLAEWDSRATLACRDAERFDTWRSNFTCGTATSSIGHLKRALVLARTEGQRTIIRAQLAAALVKEHRYAEAQRISPIRLENACVTMAGIEAGLEGVAVACEEP